MLQSFFQFLDDGFLLKTVSRTLGISCVNYQLKSSLVKIDLTFGQGEEKKKNGNWERKSCGFLGGSALLSPDIDARTITNRMECQNAIDGEGALPVL